MINIYRINSIIDRTWRSIMKLENLKIAFNAKATNGNSVDVEFDIGSLELTPEEHADELRVMEKFLPFLNSALNELTAEMATADNKKKE